MELTELLLIGILLAIIGIGFTILFYIKSIAEDMEPINHNIGLIVKSNDVNYHELSEIKNYVNNILKYKTEEQDEKRETNLQGWPV